MLWALLGLSIPIIIHLFSNRESKEILFGSTMFLVEEETSNPKAIALSDLLLLLVRCSLLSLIVVLIAEPNWTKSNIEKQVWIEQEIYNDPNYQEVLSLYHNNYDEQVFDVNGGDSSITQYPSLWTVIAAANTEEDSVVILSFNRLKHFKGSTINLKGHVQFVPIPRIEDDVPLNVGNMIYKKRDEYQITSLDGNTKSDESIPYISVNLFQIDKTTEPLVDLINIISKEIGINLVYDSINYDYIISSDDLDIPTNKKAIIWKESDDPLKIINSNSNLLKIEGAVNQKEILTSNIAISIGTELIKSSLDLELIDNRPLPLNINTKSDEHSAYSRNPISTYWWLMILPMFWIERHLSNLAES